jgi:hypothetical protein
MGYRGINWSSKRETVSARYSRIHSQFFQQAMHGAIG